MALDNRSIKDGVGNLFGLRMRDISPGGDGSLLKPIYFAQMMPIEYGSGGAYSVCSRMTMTAGLSFSNIWSFRWPSSTLLAVIRRLKLNLDTLTVGFTAGSMHIDAYRATAFTSNDTGTLVNLNNVAKMRSNMPSSSAIITWGSPLTAGARSLDSDPLDSFVVNAPTTASTTFASGSAFFNKAQGEHPLVLAANEGIVVQATAPATGTWHCNLTLEWEEVQNY